ncbi:hypothetical protein H4R21_004954 [Coemansia helicoidea]|uniref:Uncharacterized protein n=1 Tax=Coemansia helicoidea TaxID=1286919 RepID=A0ACC1KWB5_9FUNG|nr:hypothetical protein H4R21_004954 [Coemansia helicoidea]
MVAPNSAPCSTHCDTQPKTLGETGAAAGARGGCGFDDLSPQERDRFLREVHAGFRAHLVEAGRQSGFVVYPSPHQIARAATALYQALDEIDFSDIAL